MEEGNKSRLAQIQFLLVSCDDQRQILLSTSLFVTHISKLTPTPIHLSTATLEMEMYQLVFNKIGATCFTKCAARKHKDADLSLGEMTCADRCVSKYLEAQEKVAAVLEKANQAQVAQQKAMTDMQQSMGGR